MAVAFSRGYRPRPPGVDGGCLCDPDTGPWTGAMMAVAKLIRPPSTTARGFNPGLRKRSPSGAENGRSPPYFGNRHHRAPTHGDGAARCRGAMNRARHADARTMLATTINPGRSRGRVSCANRHHRARSSDALALLAFAGTRRTTPEPSRRAGLLPARSGAPLSSSRVRRGISSRLDSCPKSPDRPGMTGCVTVAGLRNRRQSGDAPPVRGRGVGAGRRRCADGRR